MRHVSNSESPRFTLRARLASLQFAGRGLCDLVCSEQNARVHLVATLLVCIAGYGLRLSLDDWRWVTAACALVWMAEAMNTAIERLCDHVTPEFHDAIGRVKDLAAGAVLVASIAAALIGVLTLGPAVIAMIASACESGNRC